jgi:hypothetical protein
MSFADRLLRRSTSRNHFALGRELSNALVALFPHDANTKFLAVTPEDDCLVVFLDRPPTLDTWRCIPRQLAEVPVVVRWPRGEILERPDNAQWPSRRPNAADAHAVGKQVAGQLAWFFGLQGTMGFAIRDVDDVLELHVAVNSDAHWCFIDGNLPRVVLTVVDGHARRLTVHRRVRWIRTSADKSSGLPPLHPIASH